MSEPITRTKHVQRVIINTMGANLAVAIAKLSVGLATRSLAMVADGLHSLLDAASNIVALIGNSVASRPPDDNHPYGHRRFETLASMIIGGVLLLTAWEIITTSIRRIGTTDVPPNIGPINFAVVISTMFINLMVTIYQTHKGHEFKSELLLADALHTQSDIFASLTVLASLFAIQLGLPWVDTAAALVIVGLILKAAWEIVSRSGGILVDEAPLDATVVQGVIEDVAGIEEVARVRSRGSADDVHLDVDIVVPAPTTAAHSDAITSEVRSRLQQSFDGLSDIRVVASPAVQPTNDLTLITRAEADALGLKVHEVRAVESEGRLRLSMHVEVPLNQTVGQAHEVVTTFEKRLHQAIPNLDKTLTHIEPLGSHENRLVTTGESYMLAGKALMIAESAIPEWSWHELDMYVEVDGGYVLTMHAYVEASMPLTEAHHSAEKVEAKIRAEIPRLHEVTIHTEPFGCDD